MLASSRDEHSNWLVQYKVAIPKTIYTQQKVVFIYFWGCVCVYNNNIWRRIRYQGDNMKGIWRWASGRAWTEENEGRKCYDKIKLQMYLKIKKYVYI